MDWIRRFQGHQWDLKPGQELFLDSQQKAQTEANYEVYTGVKAHGNFLSRLNRALTTYKDHLLQLRQDQILIASLLQETTTAIDNATHPVPNDLAYCIFLKKVIASYESESELYSRHADVVAAMDLPLNNFSSSIAKIDDTVEQLLSSREEFIQTATKVKAINQGKKVSLPKLQKMEAERDQKKAQFNSLNEKLNALLGDTINMTKYDVLQCAANVSLEKLELADGAFKALSSLKGPIDAIQDMIALDLSKKTKTSDESSKLTGKASRLTPTIDIFSRYEMFEGFLSGIMFPVVFPVFQRNEKSKTEIKIFSDGFLTFGASSRKEIRTILGAYILKDNQLRFAFRSADARFTFESRATRDLCHELFWFFHDRIHRPLTVEGKIPRAQDIKVLCGTWNLGEAPPNWYTDPIGEWLTPGHDIYAISLQECTYTPRSGFATCEEDFFGWVLRHIGDNYVKLAGVSLMGIRTVVFIKRHHYYKVDNVRYATVPTGIAGIIGNKGGAAVTFTLYGQSFCFLGSHLEARIDYSRLLERNQNCKDILTRMPFSQWSSDIQNEFDYFFWLGDLNYRIELERQTIIDTCAIGDANALNSMKPFDQLRNQMKLGNCFSEFQEGDINFIPTYRYDRGTREWSEEKKREPAWCDRVLWKAVHEEDVTLLEYSATHSMMTSDHSPVRAVFNMKVPLHPLPHRRKKCQLELRDVSGALNIEGKKTVYLSIQAPWVSGNMVTSGASSSPLPSPKWGNEALPLIFPLITLPESMSRLWFLAILRDSSSPSKNSILATGVVKVTINGSWKCTLTDKGCKVGTLSGNMQVFWDEESVPETSEDSTMEAMGIGWLQRPLPTLDPPATLANISTESSSFPSLSSLASSASNVSLVFSPSQDENSPAPARPTSICRLPDGAVVGNETGQIPPDETGHSPSEPAEDAEPTIRSRPHSPAPYYSPRTPAREGRRRLDGMTSEANNDSTLGPIVRGRTTVKGGTPPKTPSPLSTPPPPSSPPPPSFPPPTSSSSLSALSPQSESLKHSAGEPDIY
eukprot:TRINITY_DN8432_c0_g1_i1.p1 TRINITY_DN8432_c0_g1~~TRINITY_DN8432_c0_g1_i1.p1  ORF type:complete len:1031 (+),score=159.25 TRINITY_DN8432_c0_g1_i1:58-3150(+)